ncbi:hypothetical protein ABZ848_24545 [Streptomyces sp. NPDC047081]|uniref:hypothetical protein n=1 Tax=Streptomyces sp. NPDC047081 TaxID=3154706 RepID=UPI0033FA6CAB
MESRQCSKVRFAAHGAASECTINSVGRMFGCASDFGRRAIRVVPRYQAGVQP